MRRRSRGFTLIEMLIVVAIVAVLAAIAYPSYQEHVRKGRRAAAQSYLMDIAQRQQQYLLDKRAFSATLTDLNTTTPADVDSYYQVTIDPLGAGPPPTFTARAKPRAGGPQAADLGGADLTIDNTGAKAPAGAW